MAVKMRLTRVGKRKRPYYRVVVCDSRAPRDGRYVDRLGTYDPLREPSQIEIDHQKVRYWLDRGVQPTDTVKRLLRVSGYYQEPKEEPQEGQEAVSEPAS